MARANRRRTVPRAHQMLRQCPAALFAAIVLMVLPCAPAIAGPLEEAMATARRGDYPTALRLFRTLADQGNSYAQHSLGAMYGKGIGVRQDYAESIKWLRLAAEKGLPIAQNDLGIMYRQGWGVARDNAEAANWFRRAADQDFMPAQNNLGDIYVMGPGAPNYGEAIKWFRLAAEQDSPYAQNIIGIAYEHGLFVKQSDADAFSWYRRAANKVYDSGQLTLMHGPQYDLAAMYASGRGVSKDNVQAYMWFTLAARLGDTGSPESPGGTLFRASKETALEQRDKLAALMTGAEIAEGERLAREWSPRPIVIITPQAN
jgi:TPR repeat protein